MYRVLVKGNSGESWVEKKVYGLLQLRRGGLNREGIWYTNNSAVVNGK